MLENMMNRGSVASVASRSKSGNPIPSPTSTVLPSFVNTSATVSRRWLMRTNSGTRATAARMGCVLEQFDLTWIEEPLDCYDAEEHVALAATLDTSIAPSQQGVGPDSTGAAESRFRTWHELRDFGCPAFRIIRRC